MKILSVEDQIIEGTIKAFLFRGYSLGINDGEETTVKHTRNMFKILAAMKTTDEDYLLVYSNLGIFHDTSSSRDIRDDGWVRFVYGNEGYEVINDYSVNLESVMSEVNDAIDRYQDTL